MHPMSVKRPAIMYLLLGIMAYIDSMLSYIHFLAFFRKTSGLLAIVCVFLGIGEVSNL